MSGVRKMIKTGDFKLHYEGVPVAVIGQEVAENLKIGDDFFNPLKIYFPNRMASISSDPENAFIVKNIFPSGIFSIDHEIDRYVIVPIEFVREILNYNGRVTAIEIGLKKNADAVLIQKEIQQIAGKGFYVKDRYQQNEMLYKVMKTEKLMIYFILTFILLIASFNIIGSLTMLIIDKKQDARIILAMGEEIPKIRNIFLYEGWLISFMGTITGLLLGAFICWLQIKFGFVKLKFGDTGSFIIDYYPVKMKIIDFIIVFFTVFSINFILSWFPVRYLTKKYIFNTPL
jgi:lipoprotein-releasing system permease protein